MAVTGPRGIFRRIRTRLLVIYLSLTMFLFGSFGIFFYFVARDTLDKEMGRRLMLVAQVAAEKLDASDISSLGPGDEESLAYFYVVKILHSMIDMGAASRVYILDRDSKSLADTEASVKIGTEYFRLAMNTTEIQNAFDGKPADSTVFMGKDGFWYKSAFAPLFDGSKVVAVVGVDAGVTFFEALYKIKRNFIILFIATFIVIFTVSIFLALGVERPIARLVQSAQRLAEGDLNTHIDPTTRDEIGFLAKALENAREKIVERDRNLQMLQRGIAHEVRNPLGGMRLFCDILSEELVGSPDTLSYVDKIRREVIALENVVTEFLDYTREVRLNPQKVDLRAFLADILAGYSDLSLRGIALTQRVSDDLTEAVFDDTLIRRVFYNLISNAAQAMPNGGRLDIEIERDQGRLKFTVADSGSGIKPENLPQIFTPFFTTKDKGTGLGMSFAQKIVERHGGVITVESELGAGTRITVTLPLEMENTTHG